MHLAKDVVVTDDIKCPTWVTSQEENPKWNKESTTFVQKANRVFVSLKYEVIFFFFKPLNVLRNLSVIGWHTSAGKAFVLLIFKKLHLYNKVLSVNQWNIYWYLHNEDFKHLHI